MSLTVVFRQTALHNLARIRSEDKDLFGRTRHAIALLADQPCRENAVAWGATGVYRLHLGGIRILYEVDDEAATVYIIQHRGHPLNAPGRLSRTPRAHIHLRRRRSDEVPAVTPLSAAPRLDFDQPP